MICGDEILQLIPQREPFIMLDAIEVEGDTEAQSMLTVRPDNYFIIPGGIFAESGVIEHIAQSCSALASYRTSPNPGDPPIVGLIGEVKHFESLRRVRVGEVLHTHISFGFTFGNVTIANGTAKVGDDIVATAQLKIYMQTNP